MLEFFRRFQKGFFLVVTFALIVSFFFFGISSTISSDSEVEDRSVAKAVDGTDVKLFAKQRLIRFLSMDPYDVTDPSQVLNFFNDGVVRRDFLETGLIETLASSYFDVLKDDLQARLLQAKRYHPYVHPGAPFLSAQAVWDQFEPGLGKSLAALKGQLEVSPQTMTYLSELYLGQKKMPPELLRRILLYQMNQYSSIPFDRSVQYGDFSLFGFRDLSDWFGDRFIDLAAEFIWNAAIVAEEKGILVSQEEAKADLLFHFSRAVESFQKHYPDKQLSFSEQARQLAMSEKDVVDIWQKILLFRRYLGSVGEAAFVDTLFSQDLARYSQETVIADVYSLSDALLLKTPDDFFTLQYYLDSVFPIEKDRLAFPKAYLPLSEIAKKSPEFLETVFSAEIAQISKEELALRVSLKEVLEWQLEHWENLAQQFPALSKTIQLRSERTLALEKIEISLRLQIDSWTRKQIVSVHPEWIEEAFQGASFARQSICFSADRVNLAYVQDPKKFRQTLLAAIQNDPEALKQLASYSDERSNIYRFIAIKEEEKLQVRSFASMKQDGSLRRSLDAHLQSQYATVREKNPQNFQTKTGEWKPFQEVKELVGWAVFADICRAIDAKEKIPSPSNDFYIRHRFAYSARLALKTLQTSGSLEMGVDPFCLISREKKIQRTLQPDWLQQTAFSLGANEWSPLHVGDGAQVSFFLVKERKIESDFSFSLGEVGKAMICKEARQMVAKRLIHRMQGVS